MSQIRDKVLFSNQSRSVDEIAKGKRFVEVILEYAEEELSETGDRDWLIDGSDETKVTRLAEFVVKARKVGAAFHRKKIGPGDVVQIIMPNNVDFCTPVVGVWLCGGVLSLSDSTLAADIIRLQIEQSAAKMVVCNMATVEKTQKAVQGRDIEVIVMGGRVEGCTSWEDFIDADDTTVTDKELLSSLPPFDPEETAVIFWSSGTTGVPKGILHTQRFLLNVLAKSAFPPGVLIQSTLFFHTGGFFLPFDGGIRNRFTVVIFSADASGVVTEKMLTAIDKYQPAVCILGSHHVIALANSNPSPDLNLGSVNVMAPMGSGVYHHIKEDLKKRFPNIQIVLNYFGSTEIGIVTLSYTQSHLGGVVAGVEVKIVDPETGELLGPNRVGEILAKTPSCMKGYLKLPELNAAFFEEDGFAHTGDLGHYDEDGVLYYDDRLKDLIKYKGRHVSPFEIEDILLQHPDIKEAAVIGRKDPAVQEKVTAVVVLVEGSKLTGKKIIEMVNDQLEEFKHIRGGVYFMKELPKNPQGKVLKRQLKKLFP